MSKQTATATVTKTKTKKTEEKMLSHEQEVQRRDFIKVSVAAGVGLCAVGAPVCSSLRLLTAPAFAAKTKGKFYPVTHLSVLTEHPKKFTITDNKQDAWMTLPKQKIGAVFLRKIGETVSAFQALCPHAGCMLQIGLKINPKSGIKEELFYCPCHSAIFYLDGNRVNAVAPRDMDSLEVKIESERVFVKFENFTFGTTSKKFI